MEGIKCSMEKLDMQDHVIIYGAKSIALGVSCALRELFPEKKQLGFLVSSKDGNPEKLGGLPVMQIDGFAGRCADKECITVLIGTPETVHEEMIQMLLQHGFPDYICVGWQLEEKLMERLYARNHMFLSLHDLKDIRIREMSKKDARFCIFQAESGKDKELRTPYKRKRWIHTLWAGPGSENGRAAEYQDAFGENISDKNGNYCELTALYWIWKNILKYAEHHTCEYYGLYQYRRMLHIEDSDIEKIAANEVDVILPFPTMHEPDIREHPMRYIKEADWQAMLEALEELEPAYAEAFKEVQKQPYLYNYNILAAKKEILNDYCAWLFPILQRTEELSCPRGWERSDRYIGYMGENLLTLYFFYHADKLRIAHTGRIMLT